MIQRKRIPTSIGSMRDLVTVQVAARPVGPSGGKTLVWTTTATAWACVQEESGTEQVGQRQTQAETVVTVTLRWRADVVPKGRLIINGVAHDIDSAINGDGRKRFLTVTCRRREA